MLAAQFESFIDPFIIMLTVPLSMTGALAALKLSGGTLNVYSQIGLVTLVGLITKHGILIVEFANQLQAQGKDMRDAVIEAAVLRLRPILMTTGAMVLGAVPLALATGAGAESRQQIGWVIVGGMLLGTLLTLFVIPAPIRSSPGGTPVCRGGGRGSRDARGCERRLTPAELTAMDRRQLGEDHVAVATDRAKSQAHQGRCRVLDWQALRPAIDDAILGPARIQERRIGCKVMQPRPVHLQHNPPQMQRLVSAELKFSRGFDAKKPFGGVEIGQQMRLVTAPLELMGHEIPINPAAMAFD